MATRILVAALAAAILLLMEHYWLMHKRLGAPARYVLGVLALNLPLTGLWLVEGQWGALAAVWAVTGAGGAAVLASYAIDHWHQVQARLQISEGEAVMLRKEVLHGSEGSER